VAGGVSGRLASKKALVTGATGNIGRAIAVAFAGEGAHVVLSGRSAQRGSEVVDEIRTAGGQADFVAADLDGSPSASNELAVEATRIPVSSVCSSSKGALETLTRAWAAGYGTVIDVDGGRVGVAVIVPG
jgi:predicted dinucleotide-binding enzyme